MVHRQAPSSMAKVWAPRRVEEHMRCGAPQVHFVGLEPGSAFVLSSREIGYISSSLALVHRETWGCFVGESMIHVGFVR